jgi:hypothetical protein
MSESSGRDQIHAATHTHAGQHGADVLGDAVQRDVNALGDLALQLCHELDDGGGVG